MRKQSKSIFFPEKVNEKYRERGPAFNGGAAFSKPWKN
jgi:hypothetical protein